MSFFRLADDIDGDGIWARHHRGSLTATASGSFTDFDDLHAFNIFFDNVYIRNHDARPTASKRCGRTISRTTTTWPSTRTIGSRVSWGARFLRLYDEFRVDAEGSILGDSFWDTRSRTRSSVRRSR